MSDNKTVMKLCRASTKLGVPSDQLDEEIINLMFGKTDYKMLYNRLKAFKLLSAAAKSAGFDSPQKLLDFLKSYKS